MDVRMATLIPEFQERSVHGGPAEALLVDKRDVGPDRSLGVGGEPHLVKSGSRIEGYMAIYGKNHLAKSVNESIKQAIDGRMDGETRAEREEARIRLGLALSLSLSISRI
jgi:hypothetical protein